MDITDFLVYYHLAIPLILTLPLLPLFRALPEAPTDPPEIRPITIRIVTPRRSFILLTLVLLAATGLWDTILLIVEITTLKDRAASWTTLQLGSAGVYAFGQLIIWSLAAIVAEYRAKWGDHGLVWLGKFAIALEIPNLVLVVMRMVEARPPVRLFTQLAIPPSAARLLFLAVLVGLVRAPRVRYVAADETTRLLAQHPDHPGPSADRQAYGAVDGEGSSSGGNAREDRSEEGRSTPGPSKTGTNTPSRPPTSGGPDPNRAQDDIKIPKQLGAVKKVEKPLTPRQIFDRLKKLAPQLWPSTSAKLQFYVVICIFSLLIIRIGNPLLPISLGAVVRSLTRRVNGSEDTPWVPFAVYLALRYCLGGSGLLSFTQNVLWVPVAQYTDREMQMLCFNHLLNLSLAYHTKRNTGEVLKVIDRGSAINNLFQTMLFTAIPTLLDMCIAFGVLYVLYGGILASVVMGIMVIYMVFSIRFTNYRMILRRQMIDKDVKARGIVSDVLTNWESVKYFTAEEREARRFREAVVSYQETEARVQIGFNFLSLVQYFLLTLGLTLGALLISLRILEGRADAAEFVVFIQYYAQMQGPLDRFAWLYRILNQETTDAEKMFNLLSQPTEIVDKPGAKDLVVTDGIIEFKDVVFSYDGKLDALRGVSFTIGKGQSMALVGESGSGKSTILRLLYRFYDINSGQILIDGQDISQVTQLSLRRAIGIVPQDSVLWNDTIGANISYGKEGSDDEEIITAAKAARLHERILGFPEGYETIVGERGVRLSGGEKQRVSLARMFLKSPAILVLDEATSALDTETEREIQRALTDLAKDRSSLSIAHRLSTIINSDQIVVMKDGRVIENGTYKDLLETNGAFATMWKKQIHTEAEMLAQAETAGEDGDETDTNVVKGKEAELVAMVDDKLEGSHEAGKGSSVHSRSRSASRPPSPGPGGDEAVAEHAHQTEPAADGFEVTQGATSRPERSEPSGTTSQKTAEAATEAAKPSKDEKHDPKAVADEHDPETYAEAVTVNMHEQEPEHLPGEPEQEQTTHTHASSETQSDGHRQSTSGKAVEVSQDGKPKTSAAETALPARTVAGPEGDHAEGTSKPDDTDAEHHEPETYAEAVLVDLHGQEPEHLPGEETAANGATPQTPKAPNSGLSVSEAQDNLSVDTPAKRSSIGSTSSPSSRPNSMSIPSFPRLASSASQRSNLSDSPSVDGGDNSGASTPTGKNGKEGKARKRLSSIKGFVRRISDQGVQGLSRSNSMGSPKMVASPLGSPGGAPSEAERGLAAGDAKEDKKKKRMSLPRSLSDRRF